jgi:hypothetical protein
MVACIPLILSVFSFVLAAPVPVREVREARTDAVVEGDENMIIVPGKRAARGNPHEGPEEDLYPPDLSDTEWGNPHEEVEEDLYPPDLSDTAWGTPPHQSPSAPDYVSGSHPDIDMPSSGGSKSPLLSTTPGGTEVPLDSEGAFTPGTTTENQPASSSKTKKVNFWHTTKVHFFDPDLPPRPEDQSTSSSETAPSNKVLLPSGEITSEQLPPESDFLPLPPGREGYLAKVTTQPSPSPESDFLPLPPGREGYLAKVATQPSPSPESDFLPLPPGREGYLAKVATQPPPSPEIEHLSPLRYFDLPPPPPQSKGFFSKFKTYFARYFRKLGKLKFWPRFQRTVDTGA